LNIIDGHLATVEQDASQIKATLSDHMLLFNKHIELLNQILARLPEKL
jgi:hypothetical protein